MHKFAILLIFITVLLAGVLAYNKSNNKSMNLSSQNQSEGQFNEVNETLNQLENREDLTTATFAGGCFWCMEGPFEQMEGVEDVVAGYTGGNVEDPTYDQVLTDTTGHKESVKIFYDPNKVSFEKLLEIYWYQIDPTDVGGQFADRGEQYKTAIFYQTDEEKQIAEESKAELDASGKYEKPIATEILAAQQFYPAEDYHQNFYIDSAEKYERYKKLSGREDYIEANSPQ